MPELKQLIEATINVSTPDHAQAILEDLKAIIQSYEPSKN